MNAIETAWKKDQQNFGKEIEVLGIEHAFILWTRGGEVVLNLQTQSADQLRAEYVALGKKIVSQLKKKKKPR